MTMLSIKQTITLLMLLAFSSATFAAELTARIDRAVINEDESLNLTFRFSGSQVSSSPDFDPIRENFDIISTQQSNQFSNVNGRVTSFTDWHLVLFPRKSGQLLIPAITFQGAQSKALSIRVNPIGTTTTSSNKQPDIFLETEISHSEAYVQEQVLLSFKLHYSRNINKLDDQELALNGARLEQIERADYQKNIGGKHTREN